MGRGGALKESSVGGLGRGNIHLEMISKERNKECIMHQEPTNWGILRILGLSTVSISTHMRGIKNVAGLGN